MKKPKLTVLLITYNHERYIEQSIKSILEQKTNFDFDIHIAEDCSTDKTLEIVLKYQKLYPEIIKVYANETNLGPEETTRALYKRITADYIALLEGDDYWSDACKLQIQVDFLEENPNYSGTAHNTIALNEKNGEKRELFPNGLSFYNIYDLATFGTKFHTSSMVFRNIYKDKWPEEMFVALTEWLLAMIIASNGKIKYFNKVMSVYRITGKGIVTSLSKYELMIYLMNLVCCYNQFFKGKYFKYLFKHNYNNSQDISLKAIILKRDIKSLFIFLKYNYDLFKAKFFEISRYCYVNMLYIIEQ